MCIRDSFKRDGQVMGNRVRVKVVKNKVSAPFREAEFDIKFGEGFSRAGDLLDLGVAKDIVNKAGTWFSYGEERLGQGRETAKEYLQDNPALFHKLESEVRLAYGLKPLAPQKAKIKKPGATAVDTSAETSADASVKVAPAKAKKSKPAKSARA